MAQVSLYEIMQVVSKAMIDAEPQLTEFDSELGDGDCGMGMKTGFTAVLSAIDGCETAQPTDILKKTAMSLISSVGGTSGAIYGTAFMKMAAAAKNVTDFDLLKIADILEAGLNGAKMRGENTQVGDKTLVDALEPAVYAFKEKAVAGATLQDACTAAAIAAKEGSDSTIGLIAKKGRASYLGERSIGHRDAGSYGIFVIAKAIEEAVKQ